MYNMVSIEEEKSFIWSIPSIQNYKQLLLCNGYVKRNYNKLIYPQINIWCLY